MGTSISCSPQPAILRILTPSLQSIIGAVDIFPEINSFSLSSIVVDLWSLHPVFHMHDPILTMSRTQVAFVGGHQHRIRIL
jgi:hypothetical protein